MSTRRTKVFPWSVRLFSLPLLQWYVERSHRTNERNEGCLGGEDTPSHCDGGLFYDKSRKKSTFDSWGIFFSLIEHGCQWPKDVPHCLLIFRRSSTNLSFVFSSPLSPRSTQMSCQWSTLTFCRDTQLLSLLRMPERTSEGASVSVTQTLLRRNEKLWKFSSC